MIIGAIETADPTKISGWLHSESGDLSDALVLAFLDDVCVGAGRVDRFRQDLADAGLGNGRRGFSFPIAVPNPNDFLRVAVRLDRCETFLLQPGTVLTNRNTPRETSDFVAGDLPRPAHRAWLRARGWLQPGMEDLLESIESFGVGAFVCDVADTTGEQSARQLFETIMLGPIEVDSITIPDAAKLRDIVFAPDGPARDAGLLVLSAARRLSVMAVENRLVPPGTEGAEPDLTGAITHPVDQRHILAVRRWVPFDIAPTPDKHEVRVWFPRKEGIGAASREQPSLAGAAPPPSAVQMARVADRLPQADIPPTDAGQLSRRSGQQRRSEAD